METNAPVGVDEQTNVGSVFISNYPPYSAWSAEQVPQARAALAARPAPETPLGLYMHIPFCRVRCKFCYFKVYTEKDSSQIRSYLSALAAEVGLLARMPAVAGRALDFVYFGGGTPSFISARDLKHLVSSVRAALPWDKAQEITFECEPGTLTEAKLDVIRGIGVTRLSLGVESFDDGILKENGRAHLSAEVDRVLPWIQQRKFDQLNIDLIAGMVGETWETWRHSVRRTLEAAPDSVTIYQMELPFNTVYSKSLLDGDAGLDVSGWDLKRAWHGYAIDELSAAGYEISSAYTMVKRGSRFIYRDAMFHGADLLGTGVASFSHVNGVHFQNASEWDAYIRSLQAGELPLSRAFAATPRHRLVRELILSLKLGGIQTDPFKAKFGVDVLAEFEPIWRRLENQGMLRGVRGGIELTREGLLRADLLLPEFYAPEYRHARYT